MNGHTHGYVNGEAKENTKLETDMPQSNRVKGNATRERMIDGWEPGMNPKVDRSDHFEFGGDLGVSAMMVGFPLLMYYMWIGATYYEGKFPLPRQGETFTDFLRGLF
jgi:delta24(24(1))-sterol reductase